MGPPWILNLSVRHRRRHCLHPYSVGLASLRPHCAAGVPTISDWRATLRRHVAVRRRPLAVPLWPVDRAALVCNIAWIWRLLDADTW